MALKSDKKDSGKALNCTSSYPGVGRIALLNDDSGLSKRVTVTVIGILAR